MTATYVYNARSVSEDDNPWDGNESFGMYTTPEAAQKAIQEKFRSHDQDDTRWLPVGTTYTGVEPNAPTWKLHTRASHETWEDDYAPDENGEFPDDSGYGLYVIQEVLRDGS